MCWLAISLVAALAFLAGFICAAMLAANDSPPHRTPENVSEPGDRA